MMTKLRSGQRKRDDAAAADDDDNDQSYPYMSPTQATQKLAIGDIDCIMWQNSFFLCFKG